MYLFTYVPAHCLTESAAGNPIQPSLIFVAMARALLNLINNALDKFSFIQKQNVLS
jgi:hypothetical protein